MSDNFEKVLDKFSVGKIYDKFREIKKRKLR